MARGYLKAKEYRMTDIRNYILGLMKEKKIRQYRLADAIGVEQPAFSKKLDKCDFNIEELLIIFKILEADQDKVGRLFILKEEK